MTSAVQSPSVRSTRTASGNKPPAQLLAQRDLEQQSLLHTQLVGQKHIFTTSEVMDVRSSLQSCFASMQVIL